MAAAPRRPPLPAAAEDRAPGRLTGAALYSDAPSAAAASVGSRSSISAPIGARAGTARRLDGNGAAVPRSGRVCAPRSDFAALLQGRIIAADIFVPAEKDQKDQKDHGEEEEQKEEDVEEARA